MRYIKAALWCCALVCVVCPLEAQNYVLGRILGQNSLVDANASTGKYYTFNLVEGREFNNPYGVAIDATATPSIIYVADSGNNRILGWHDAGSFQNGAPADIVMGQNDFFATGAGTSRTSLRGPSGLAVDAQGNLWVADSDNNRILRYPKPFAQTGSQKLPDQVVGQVDYNHGSARAGGLSATSLSLASSARSGITFDAAGNLWLADSADNRVLRFPVDTAKPGYVQTTADLVLGQAGFITSTAGTAATAMDKLRGPFAVSFDTAGDLYVSDNFQRVLVFQSTPPIASGQAAQLMIGGVLQQDGTPVKPPTASSLNTPAGVRAIPTSNEILVVDTNNNRILKFPNIALWLGQTPVATAVYGQVVEGQPSYTTATAASGATGLDTPVDVAIGPSGDFFVADSNNHRVLVYPAHSTTATRVLGQDSLDDNAPNLVEGRELHTVGVLNGLGIASAVAVDKHGTVPRLYVSDPGNNRVLGYCDARKAKQGDKADLVIGQADFHKWKANGDGGANVNDQNLSAPSGLITDSQGDLFVADTGNGRVLRFAAPCDQPAGQQSFPHANLVLGQADFTSHLTGTTQTSLNGPFGLALTATEGYLMVSDVLDNRVLRYEKPQGGDFQNGEAAAAVFGQQDFVSTGSGNQLYQLNSPRHLAEDAFGRLYIADFNNSRILVISDSAHAPSGKLPAMTIDRTADANTALHFPHGLSIDSGNTLWVAPASSEHKVWHYPNYDTMLISPYITGSAPVPTVPVGVAVDNLDNPIVTETGSNGTMGRVAFYYPEIATTNAATFLQNQALAPGLIVTTYTKHSQAAVQADTLPVPTTLGNLQVLVDNTLAPIFYVGDSQYPGFVQVNYQMPTHLADGSVPDTGVVAIQTVRADTGQVVGAGAAVMGSASPALFTFSGTGSGQVTAINGDDSNDAAKFTCNGPAGPATPRCPGGVRAVKRGEILILYLTGQGFQSNGPEAGNVVNGPAPLDGPTRVILGTNFVPDANILYSGAAPCCAGLWQINFTVPNDNVAPGQPNKIAVVYRDVPSMINGVPATTVMIQ